MALDPEIEWDMNGDVVSRSKKLFHFPSPFRLQSEVSSADSILFSETYYCCQHSKFVNLDVLPRNA